MQVKYKLTAFNETLVNMTKNLVLSPYIHQTPASKGRQSHTKICAEAENVTTVTLYGRIQSSRPSTVLLRHLFLPIYANKYK